MKYRTNIFALSTLVSLGSAVSVWGQDQGGGTGQAGGDDKKPQNQPDRPDSTRADRTQDDDRNRNPQGQPDRPDSTQVDRTDRRNARDGRSGPMNLTRADRRRLQQQMQTLRSLRFTLQEELDMSDEEAAGFDSIFNRRLTDLDALQRLDRGRTDPDGRTGDSQRDRPGDVGDSGDSGLPPPQTGDTSAGDLDELDTLMALRRQARTSGDRDLYRDLSARLRDYNRESPEMAVERERFLTDVRSGFKTDEQRATFDRLIRDLNSGNQTQPADRASRYSTALDQFDMSPEQRASFRSLRETFDQDFRDARDKPEMAQALVDQYREDIVAELNDQQRDKFFETEQAMMPANERGSAARTFAALRDVKLRDPQQLTYRTIREQYLRDLRQLSDGDPQRRQEVYDRLRRDVIGGLDDQQQADFLEAERRMNASTAADSDVRAPAPRGGRQSPRPEGNKP